MNQFIDHHSFLVENNLFTDEMKDNMAMMGYCLVENVKDSSTMIDFNKLHVEYLIVIPGKLYKNLKLLKKFQGGENIGLWGSIRLKRFLRKKRELEKKDDTMALGYELEQIANNFVKSYLNEKWSASVKMFNADDKNEIKDFGLRSSGDKPTD